MSQILIVDDQYRDAGMVCKAIAVCLKILQQKPGLQIVDSEEEAYKYCNKFPPDLVITDLFMPTGDFDNNIDIQCDEMENPHGIRLLASLKESKIQKLVTTFFWDYPGFTRFTNAFEQLGVEAVLPKDLFYIAGLLTSSDPEHCPPLRIITIMLNELLKENDGSFIDKRLRHLLFRSLFKEACAWLSTHPHLVLEARNLISANGQSEKQGRRKPLQGPTHNKASTWEEASEIVQYAHNSLWLPSFEFWSPNSGRLTHTGHYKLLMEDTRQMDWSVCMRTARPMKVDKIDNSKPLNFKHGEKDRSIRSYPSSLEPIRVEKFLKPPNDSHYAQLLLTLSFFSYWCHIPDYCAMRTPEDIGHIISKRAGFSYRGLGQKEVGEAISKDLEMLSYRILETIRRDHNYNWWRFLKHNLLVNGVDSIGSKRNQYYSYWLNASLLLVPEESL